MRGRRFNKRMAKAGRPAVGAGCGPASFAAGMYAQFRLSDRYFFTVMG